MTTPPLTPVSTSRRIAAVAVFLLVAVIATYAFPLLMRLYREHSPSLYHLATVQPGVLYRDGNRSSAEFKRAIGRTGVKTVVCLVTDQEVADPGLPQFKEEFDFLKQKGIRLERIPIRAGGWPTTDDLHRFLAIVDQPENRPVLVHCAQGVHRTGMMAAAFQESRLGYDKQRAKAEIITFGHSESTIESVRRFIDAYDPNARAVSADLK